MVPLVQAIAKGSAICDFFSMSSEEKFVECMQRLLVTLPYDLKVFFEAISDENLPIEARKLATAAIAYCLSPSDPIPDSTGLLGHVDDAVVQRLSLKRLMTISGDQISDYPQRFPEQFEHLDEDVTAIRSYLGDSVGWIDGRLEKILHTKHKGKKLDLLYKDEEGQQLLYEDSLTFTTDYEIDDEAAQRLKSGQPVLKAFQDRAQVEARR